MDITLWGSLMTPLSFTLAGRKGPEVSNDVLWLAWLQVVQNLKALVEITGELRWWTGFQRKPNRKKKKRLFQPNSWVTWNLNAKKCIKTHKTTSFKILDSEHVTVLSEPCSKQNSEKSIHTSNRRASQPGCWGPALEKNADVKALLAWFSPWVSLVGTRQAQNIHSWMLWAL